MTLGLQEEIIAGVTSKGSRYRKSLYEYPTFVNDPLYNFVANRVVVEINSFANPYPFVKKRICSFITSFLEEQGLHEVITEYELQPFELNVLDKRRTLCEKVVSLLRFSFMNNPIDGLGGKIRHFYDIHFLLKDTECAQYVETSFIKDLLELIEHDKQIFNVPENWKQAEICQAPLLTSFNDMWYKLSGIYEKELKALAYDKIPSSHLIHKSMTGFIAHINKQLDLQ